MTSTDWRFEEFSCPLCGPMGEEFTGFRGGRAHRSRLGVESRIVRCKSCGLIYANPMPRPVRAFSNYREPAQYFRHHDRPAKIEHYAARLHAAERLLGRKGSFVDVGCGTGESLVAAEQLGWRAAGVEPAAEFAGFARRMYGVDVKTCELADADIASGSVDLVTLGAVLEHVYDPLALLREVRRVLCTGGVAFIGVPNELGLYWRIGNLYHRVRGRDWVINISPTFEPYHTLGWSKRSLAKALRSSGFQPLHCWTTANSDFYELTRATASFYERASEVVDKLGALFDSGSQLDTWGRAI